MKIHYLPR